MTEILSQDEIDNLLSHISNSSADKDEPSGDSIALALLSLRNVTQDIASQAITDPNRNRAADYLYWVQSLFITANYIHTISTCKKDAEKTGETA